MAKPLNKTGFFVTQVDTVKYVLPSLDFVLRFSLYLKFYQKITTLLHSTPLQCNGVVTMFLKDFVKISEFDFNNDDKCPMEVFEAIAKTIKYIVYHLFQFEKIVQNSTPLQFTTPLQILWKFSI